jgi:hypothetical protein
MQNKLTKRAERARQLYDYAVGKPEGFTYEEVERDLGWERVRFFGVVRELRLILGDDDEITLPCEPQGPREPWLYRLVGNYDDVRPWVVNRLGDMEARIETLSAVAHTCARVTDARSIEGRKARKVSRTMDYLASELAEIGG